MNRHLLICLIPLLLTSCRTPSLPVPIEVARVQTAYEAARLMAFEARLSVVFEFRPHWWRSAVQVAALGHVMVNPRTGDYSLVCFSPSGQLLFEVTRTNGQATARIEIPLTGDKQESEKLLSEDIGRFYFDLAPAPGATISQKDRYLVFRNSPGKDWSEYEYDIVTTRLVRKVICHDGECITLAFEDYQHYPSGYYPSVMKLTNHKNRYTLTLQNLSLRPAR